MAENGASDENLTKYHTESEDEMEIRNRDEYSNNPQSQSLFDNEGSNDEDNTNDKSEGELTDNEGEIDEDVLNKTPEATEELEAGNLTVSDSQIIHLASQMVKLNADPEAESDAGNTSDGSVPVRKSRRPKGDVDYVYLDKSGRGDKTPTSRKDSTGNKTEANKEKGQTIKDKAKGQAKKLADELDKKDRTIGERDRTISYLRKELNTVKEDLEKVKKELKEEQEKASQLQAENAKKAKKLDKNEETTKTIKQRETQIAQQLANEKSKNQSLRVENEEKIRERDDSKEELRITKQKETLITQQLTMERNKNADLKKCGKGNQANEDKIKKLGDEVNLYTQENLKLHDEIETKNTEIQKRNKQLEQKTTEFDSLITSYIDMQEQALSQQQEVTANEATQQQQPPQQKSTLLMMDSNGRRIKPKLPRSEGVNWQHLNNIYRATDIPTQLQAEDAQKQLNRADSVVVMVGLNEIRDGKSATEAYNSIEANIQQLASTLKPITLIEVPPVAYSVTDKNEAKCLNRLLKRIPQRYPNISILESWEELSEPDPETIFEDDNFHLDAEKDGTTIMAQKIFKHIQKIHSMPSDHTTKEIISHTISIEENTAQHYIGKQGSILKKLTKDHSVNIAVPRDQNKVIITGPEENVKKATLDIVKIKDEQAKSTLRYQNSTIQHHGQATNSITCRYYERGNCTKGDQCTFRHEQKARTSSSSTTQMSGERTEDRTHRPRSRTNERKNQDRSRSDVRRDQSGTQERRNKSPEERRPRNRSTDRKFHSQEERNHHRSRTPDRNYHSQPERRYRPKSSDRTMSNMSNSRRERGDYRH